jgi:4,5-DOPA dioxygenase extradiol
MNHKDLENTTTELISTDRMPALFIGHGSPMNAIEENEFVEGFRNIEKTIPKPQAVLCISAHWETRGTLVTTMELPTTIHDFGGFPEELYQVQYPAPGHPQLARDIQQTVKTAQVGSDYKWGLDHGAWSVIRHFYPMADIPVIQLSLDHNQNPQYHYDLGRELSVLRDKGVLIIGSGNMVHNMRLLNWEKMKEDNYGFDWAIEAGDKLKQLIRQKGHDSLIAFRSLGKAIDLAIPTFEHYLPLLYILALQDMKDEIRFFNDKFEGGSIGMTSVRIG